MERPSGQGGAGEAGREAGEDDRGGEGEVEGKASETRAEEARGEGHDEVVVMSAGTARRATERTGVNATPYTMFSFVSSVCRCGCGGRSPSRRAARLSLLRRRKTRR
eukprot:31307-Pelagococcus_subviridis.AAC.4